MLRVLFCDENIFFLYFFYDHIKRNPNTGALKLEIGW